MRRQPKTVSVIIPVYNERRTIARILAKVVAADTLGLIKEIIVVDDGSTDGTTEILKIARRRYARLGSNFRLLSKPTNEGKGASLRRGFSLARGEIILVQDADLEYDPIDYPKLLAPITKQGIPVVYGSRMLNHGKMHHGGIFFFAGGQIINWLTNLLYGLALTDEATGYKVFHAEVLDQIDLRCKRFEFCPELTAKLALAHIPIREVAVSYRGRTPEQGKKINWRDGVEAIWTLVRYRM